MQGYRHGGGTPHNLQLDLVPGVTVASVLLESRGRNVSSSELTSSSPLHYDLLKLDGDGPEGSWMVAIELLIANRQITVDVITLEGNGLAPNTMIQFQQKHGYTIYRLESGEPLRRIGPTGWDAKSPVGTPMAALPRAPTIGNRTSRDDLETEIFSLRTMRHLFKAAPNLTSQEWRVLLSPIRAHTYGVNQWLLTRGVELQEAYVMFGHKPHQ